jgi:ribonuclease HI
MKTGDKNIIIYCDGACSGNQFGKNVGGWGAVVKDGDQTRTLSGGEKNTTNQRMELTACLKALEQAGPDSRSIDVYSDSAYLVNCFKQRWYAKWITNGWKNAKGQPVENQDLWERLLDRTGRSPVVFHKVTGHSGDGLNEMADQLARKGIEASRKA